MKCPTCPDSTLLITERSGIEIDYCPNCRGVWLDRGELDKLVERAATAATPNVIGPPPPQQPMPPQPYQQRPMKPDDSHYGYPSPYPKKRKSWLGEIFD